MRGHSDKKTAFHKLSRPQQLNVLADKLATQQCKEMEEQPPNKSVQLASHYVRLYINDRLYTGKEKNAAMKAYSTQKLAKYYRKKFGWDETTYDRVNWEAIQRARAKLAPEQQKFVTKMFINWLPLNNRTEKYIGGSSPACIACQQPETHNHLYQCAQQNTWKIDFLSKLKALLFEMETLPEVRLTILSALQEELDDTPQQQR